MPEIEARYTQDEMTQAEEDERHIREILGDDATDEDFLKAALRLCFPEAANVALRRAR